MEKKQYEAIKALKLKVENKTATFKERIIYKIIQDRKEKGKPIYFK